MPRSLFDDYSCYIIYFWACAMSEPIYVHIAKGEQNENVTKVWIADNREEIAFRWMAVFNQKGELKKF